ncbi:MAG: DUF4399 domain-containing protein [Myxococcota bacterium]|nr:DUF4399 domain-containing protein [Myxococcota bacterium]
MRYWTLALIPVFALLSSPAQAHCGECGVGGDAKEDHTHGEAHAAAAGAKVFFVSPADGATVKGPVTVKMGVEGMTVQPAGQLTEGTGHHHVIIDAKGVPKGTAVPADDQHIHFGKGQTETTLELAPGEHTLTLQFADGAHRSYGPEMSATIKVTVTE